MFPGIGWGVDHADQSGRCLGALSDGGNAAVPAVSQLLFVEDLDVQADRARRGGGLFGEGRRSQVVGRRVHPVARAGHRRGDHERAVDLGDGARLGRVSHVYGDVGDRRPARRDRRRLVAGEPVRAEQRALADAAQRVVVSAVGGSRRALVHGQREHDTRRSGERADRDRGRSAQCLGHRHRAGRFGAEAHRDDQRRGHRAERRDLRHLAGRAARAEQAERVGELAVERDGDALRTGREQQRVRRRGVLAVDADDDRVDGQLRRVGIDEA